MEATRTAVAATGPSTSLDPTAAAASTSALRRLVDLDTALSLQIHNACKPVIPRSVLKTLEISGDGRFWFPVPIALLLSSPKSTSLTRLLFALLAGSLLDLLVVGLVKYLVRRPRPVYNKDMFLTVAVDHWSFPSGHSSRVFFIAAFLRLCSDILREAALGFRGRIFGCDGGDLVEMFVLLVSLWSVFTSASRILLGRHFMLDVVAGACLGMLEALFVFYFFQNVR